MTGVATRRVLPIAALCLLLVAVYWLYSLHTTTANDWRDLWLGAILTVLGIANIAYLLLRTERLVPQILGIVSFVLGEVIFYGSVTTNRLGWSTVSAERQFDGLRAAVTVALVLYWGGVAWFEIGQWRKRRKGALPDVVVEAATGKVYDRRSGLERRRDWCRDYCREGADDA